MASLNYAGLLQKQALGWFINNNNAVVDDDGNSPHVDCKSF